MKYIEKQKIQKEKLKEWGPQLDKKITKIIKKQQLKE